MKTFGDYLHRRLKEDGEPPMGIGPTDIGIKARDDGPIDKDQEAQMGKLVQLAKTASHKHPDLVIGMLEKLAEKDGEIRSGLEALKGEMHRTGNKFKDKGLGNMGNDDQDHKDQIMPPYADMTSGGEDGSGGGE